MYDMNAATPPFQAQDTSDHNNLFHETQEQPKNVFQSSLPRNRYQSNGTGIGVEAHLSSLI